jgi:hypothetical protein
MSDDMQHDETAYEQARENLKDETAGAGEKSPFETFVDKQRVAADEFAKALEELFPAGFREHTRKAGQAFAESFKVLLDSARVDFEEMMKRSKESRPTESGGESNTKVKVDIE